MQPRNRYATPPSGHRHCGPTRSLAVGSKPAPSVIAEVEADRRIDSAFLDLETKVHGEIGQRATIDFRDAPPEPRVGIARRVLRVAEILDVIPRVYHRASAA
jgi:hypothetical protein